MKANLPLIIRSRRGAVQFAESVLLVAAPASPGICVSRSETPTLPPPVRVDRLRLIQRQSNRKFAPLIRPFADGRDGAAMQFDERANKCQPHAQRRPRGFQRSGNLRLQIENAANQFLGDAQAIVSNSKHDPIFFPRRTKLNLAALRRVAGRIRQ